MVELRLGLVMQLSLDFHCQKDDQTGLELVILEEHVVIHSIVVVVVIQVD